VTISGNKSQHLFIFLAGLFIISLAVAVYTEQYLLAAAPFAVLIFYAGWQNKNSIFFLLLATLPFSFEYNFSSGLGTDIPDEFLMLLMSVLFFAYWLYFPKAIKKNVLRHPLLFLLLVVVCWTVLTVIFSGDRQISGKYLLAKSWYICAFVLAPLVIFREKKSIVMASIVLVGSMLLVTAIALIRHNQTGFSFATINNAVSPFFRNHVNYSAMLVCMLPVLAALFQFTKKKKLKLLLSIAIIVALVALFFSYARGAWLALLAGSIAYWLVKKRLFFYSYIAAIIITVSLLFWLKENDRYLEYAHNYKTTIFHKDFSEHLVSTYKLKDISTAERFYRWIAGVRMIKNNWLTGYGPNTFYDNYKGYAVPAYKTWVSDNPEHSTVHNYFLLIAIEQGIPGVVFFLLLLGAMIYYAQYLYHRADDIFYKTVSAVIGVMLTMIIVLNFLSDLIETDKIGSLFFLCLATLIVTDVNTRKGSDSSPDIQRIS
jgi:O-antigen ligase